MKIILSFAPQTGFERLENNIVVLDKNNWLYLLVKKYNEKNEIEYLGRDHIGRIEISISFPLFN